MNRQDDLDFLAYLVKDAYALFEYRDVLKHYHFRDRNSKTLYGLISTLAYDNEEIPTQREVVWNVQQGGLPLIEELSPLEKQHLLRDVADVYSGQVTGTTGNRVRKFIAERTFRHLSNALGEQKFSTIESMRNSVTSLQQKISNLAELLSPVQEQPIDFPLSKEAIKAIPETLAGIFDREAIPLPWGRFNDVTGGGMHKGEVSLLVGLTGTGKTTHLLNMGMNVSGLKRLCVMYSLDDTRIQVLNRAYCYWAGFSSQGVELHELQQRIILNLQNQSNPYFVLRSFPRRTITAEFIRRDLAKIRLTIRRMWDENGWSDPPEIELVIVDYLDMMKLPRAGKEFRHKLEELANNLGTLAGQENVHVATATQSNAKGLRQEIIDEGNIAEGFSKLWPCKLGIAISGSKGELHNGRVRLTLFKNTWGPSGYINPCTVNWEKQRVEEVDNEALIPIGSSARNAKTYTKEETKLSSASPAPQMQAPTSKLGDKLEELEKKLKEFGND